MTTITLDSFTHNAKSCIALNFPYNFEVKEYIKKGPAVKWTQTHRCFYIYYDELALANLKDYLKAANFKVISKPPDVIQNNRRGVTPSKKPLNKEKTEVYKHFIAFLEGKRYSASTIRSYAYVILDFLRYTGDKPTVDLDANDVRLYLEWAVGTLNYAVSTHRQMVSSLKHFAHFYPTCSINTEAINMPRKDKKLPIILSITEVLHLIQTTKNLKHRVVIAMLYASGLRIGELLALELKDFDFTRNVIHVRNAKGRKDRYVSIAVSLYPLIKNYYATYTPKRYFIENPKGGMYSPTSVRSFLKKNCKNAGIRKPVTPHSLRHSYATHLLEQGTDIRYIQELLGHSRPETTMLYTQVTTKDLRDIKSPLDIALNKVNLQKPDLQNPLVSNKMFPDNDY